MSGLRLRGVLFLEATLPGPGSLSQTEEPGAVAVGRTCAEEAGAFPLCR